jgi:hypothetical protein
MTPDEVLLSFIASMGLCIRALMTVASRPERLTPITPLTVVDKAGKRVREGVVDDFGSFYLHGRGCLFELVGGEEIDFDWDADGDVVFNDWRLRTFARSLGFESITLKELRAAAMSAAHRGLLCEKTDGWFAILATGPRR